MSAGRSTAWRSALAVPAARCAVGALRRLAACGLALSLSAGLAAAGEAAHAGPRQRVLVMSTPPEQAPDQLFRVLTEGLAAAGENAEVVPVAWPADANGDADVARHLLKQGPADLVVGVSLEIAREVQRQAPQVQLLFDSHHDPRHSCVVDSLDRPGKNATGSFVLAQEGEKMTDLLLAAFPGLRQVVVLVTDDELGQQPCPDEFEPRPANRRCRSGWVDDAQELQRLVVPPSSGSWTEPGQPVTFRFWRVCSAPDIVALSALAKQPRTGIVVLLRELFYHQRELLVRTLNETRKPAVYLGAIFVQTGGLMALHPKLTDTNQMTVRLTRLILHGRPAGSLPVSTPRSNAILFNRVAARGANLVPSVSFLRRVDDFVQFSPVQPGPSPEPSTGREKKLAGRATPVLR